MAAADAGEIAASARRVLGGLVATAGITWVGVAAELLARVADGLRGLLEHGGVHGRAAGVRQVVEVVDDDLARAFAGGLLVGVCLAAEQRCALSVSGRSNRALLVGG